MSASTLPAQAGRFAIIGVANTLITGVIFLGLATLLPVSLAYTIAFGLGIVFVTVITPRLVFSARPSVSRRLVYTALYLVVYVVGLVCVAILSDVLYFERPQLVVCSVAATATLSFLGGRLLFARRPTGEGT